MLVGATVLCVLVLLVLLADRLGAAVFHGETSSRFYRCEACDLRYPKREMVDPQLRTCPAGHVVTAERAQVSAGLVGVFVCLGFIVAALILIVAGVSR